MTRPYAVVDTNVVSYLFNRHPLAGAYAQHLQPYHTLISFQTLAELRYGALKDGWGPGRSGRLEALAQSFQVIYPTDSICTAWATLRVHARQSGRPIDTADAWIAATALAVGCPLVTHNAADFAGVPGLTVLTEG